MMDIIKNVNVKEGAIIAGAAFAAGAAIFGAKKGVKKLNEVRKNAKKPGKIIEVPKKTKNEEVTSEEK